jgi:hypothetical protein
MLRPLPSPATGLPRCPNHHAYVPCPLPRRIGTGACVDCFPIPRGLPRISGWVGIRIVLFEACSGFTRVTARMLAQPPKAAFVTGLRRNQLPGHAARQLPAQSTTRWVEPSSTGVSRLRGAPEEADMRAVPGQPSEIANSQDGSTSDCGHRHPVQHAILSENQTSPATHGK